MRVRPVVMVVEDDEEMNQLQRDLLAVHDLDAVAAYTGLEALEVCGRCQADAVLLDLMLPELDGFETCQRLRKDRNQRLPIVIVTALDGEDWRRRGLQAGADAYFSKPFDPDEVIAAIRRLLAPAQQDEPG